MTALLVAILVAAVTQGDATAGGEEERRRAAALNEQGVQLFSAGDYLAAQQRFEAALALDRSAKEIRANLGKTYGALAVRILEESGGTGGRAYRHALDLLKKALLYWQGDGDTHHLVALCHLRLHEPAAAERALRRALELAPDSFGSWHLLGVVEEQGGRLEEARASFEKALSLRPGDSDLKRRLRRLRHDQEALEAYHVLASARFRILFPEALTRAQALSIQRVLDEISEELERRWDLPPPAAVDVITYPPGEFSRRTGLAEEIGGAFDGRIRIAYPLELEEGGLQLTQVARHEAVHLFLHRLPEPPPRWLDEGLAQLLDGEPREGWRRRFLELQAKQPTVGLADREASFRQERPESWTALYLHGFLLLRDLARSRGEFRIDMVVRQVAGGAPWKDAFERVYGKDPATLDREWRRQLLADGSPAPQSPR